MNIQILKIILWPKNGTFKPRIVKFEKGKVNVISGLSKTGKSAIIPIIDFCLGSTTCTIPTDIIRKHSAWFGCLLDTPDGKILLARREPGQQKNTGDMYWQEVDDEKSIPDNAPISNANRDAVVQKLNEICGLSNLSFDANEGSGYKARPSFRDLMAFCFQPQNTVANPHNLFYKTDNADHREKFFNIFPYAMGAITPEIMKKKWELEIKENELNRLRREFSHYDQLNRRWEENIETWFRDAQGYGLINPRLNLPDNTGRTVELLGAILEKPSVNSDYLEKAREKLSSEYQDLEKEQTMLFREQSSIANRLNELERLQSSVNEYGEALNLQRDRLGISTWLKKHLQTNAICPLCQNTMETASGELASLTAVLDEVEEATIELQEFPQSFDRERVKLITSKFEVERSLAAISENKKKIEDQRQEEQEARSREVQIERFIGRLEESLKMHRQVSPDKKLTHALLQLEQEVANLQRDIRAANPEGRLNGALKKFSSYASQILPQTDVEWKHAPIELLYKDLTLKITKDDRSDYLWEVGSGANWLAYHLATIVALHKHFDSLPTSPVPSFVALDQPSQVYFPRRLADKAGQPDANINDLDDDDVVAVTKIFKVLAAASKSSGGTQQFIVLDHVPKSVWGQIENIHEVEPHWENNRKLVPTEWYENNNKG